MTSAKLAAEIKLIRWFGRELTNHRRMPASQAVAVGSNPISRSIFNNLAAFGLREHALIELNELSVSRNFLQSQVKKMPSASPATLARANG